MTRSHRPALLIALAALAGAATCAGSAEAGIFGRKKPPPVAVEAPPPPPADAPPVALSGQVIQAAGAYRAYMRKTGAMSASFTDGRGVEAMLEAAEASEPLALSRGTVAFAAVTALQEPSFVEGVRRFGVDPGHRRDVTERLIANPAYAAQLPGAAAAAARIMAALSADAAKVTGAGALVKQAAYDVQKKTWSKAEIPDRPGRLARAKALAAAPMSAAPEEIASLAAVASAAGQSRPDALAADASAAATQPYTSTVVRGLAVAALAALGQAGEDNDAAVQTLLNDASGSFCHNMAKLNLYQCLAVAKPYYEDVFCLGQHVLLDTGQCVTKGAGAMGGSASLTAAAGVTALATTRAVSP